MITQKAKHTSSNNHEAELIALYTKTDKDLTKEWKRAENHCATTNRGVVGDKTMITEKGNEKKIKERKEKEEKEKTNEKKEKRKRKIAKTSVHKRTQKN